MPPIAVNTSVKFQRYSVLLFTLFMRQKVDESKIDKNKYFSVSYIITPKHRMKPSIIAVPLSAEKDFEITILANLITLTPGTLSLDVSSDKKVLYVHSMYASDPEEFINEIKNGFERKLLEITR